MSEDDYGYHEPEKQSDFATDFMKTYAACELIFGSSKKKEEVIVEPKSGPWAIFFVLVASIFVMGLDPRSRRSNDMDKADYQVTNRHLTIIPNLTISYFLPDDEKKIFEEYYGKIDNVSGALDVDTAVTLKSCGQYNLFGNETSFVIDDYRDYPLKNKRIHRIEWNNLKVKEGYYMPRIPGSVHSLGAGSEPGTLRVVFPSMLTPRLLPRWGSNYCYADVPEKAFKPRDLENVSQEINGPVKPKPSAIVVPPAKAPKPAPAVSMSKWDYPNANKSSVDEQIEVKSDASKKLTAPSNQSFQEMTELRAKSGKTGKYHYHARPNRSLRGNLPSKKPPEKGFG